MPLLKEAYQRLRKHAAPGVDGITWEEYGEHLDARLLDLQDRIHRGSYHPQPVRRVHIPKGDGRTRPLGIPAPEGKVVQQAARMVLVEPELHPGPRPDILDPDLAGRRREQLPEEPEEASIKVPPDWACEILSDRTEAMDRGSKRRV